MSIDYKTYKGELRRTAGFRHKLNCIRSLDLASSNWLAENGKAYSADTLRKFKIQQGVVDVYDSQLGFGSRAFVCSDPCIVIPVGPILRCYRHHRPKNERWIVSPAGYPAQWLGDFSHNDLIITEGEWDFLKLQDEGFVNAVTHTAGAGTWLDGWIFRFQGKRVFIVYDRDRIGQKGAAKVAKALHGIAAEIRLVDLPLPGTPDANDISDYFRLGGDTDGFKRILERARLYISKGKVSVH